MKLGANRYFTRLYMVFSVKWYFNVTMITFLMTLWINKFTTTVVPTYNSVMKYLQSLVYSTS